MGEGWGEGSGSLAHRMGEGRGEGPGSLACRTGEGWGEGHALGADPHSGRSHNAACLPVWRYAWPAAQTWIDSNQQYLNSKMRAGHVGGGTPLQRWGFAPGR
jgi:hypothetical protein